MEILRVEVLESKAGKRRFTPLWLAWLGETMPPLETLWLHYLRRFTLEHWYRFAKQRLYWTHPQFSSLPATDRSLRLDALTQLATVVGTAGVYRPAQAEAVSPGFPLPRSRCTGVCRHSCGDWHSGSSSQTAW